MSVTAQRNIFLFINIVAAISMGVLFYFIHNQNVKIQDERRASILRSCRDTNMRHRNTIAELDKRISQLPPDRQQQAQASRAFTILLIDALAPQQDCKALVAKSVSNS